MMSQGVQRARLLRATIIALGSQRVKEVTFCVKELLQLPLKKVLHFVLKVITIRVNVTFCTKSCYILWHNRLCIKK